MNTEYEPGRISFRTQSSEDIGMLERVVPLDQSKTFVARWESGTYGVRILQLVERLETQPPAVIGEVGPVAQPESTGELSSLAAMTDEDLMTLAAERGVKWNKQASRETMVKRIAEAKPK